MVLLIDAGNSNLKLAILSTSGQISRITLEQCYELISCINTLVYSSVKESPSLTKLLSTCADNNITIKQANVTKVFSNINCGYEIVENLGVDRWLSIIGARKIYNNSHLVVVDAGTAITVDVCSGNDHLGGWIAPGLSLMQESIVSRAPGVFSENEVKYEVFGTGTPSALFHGCMYSVLGMIEQAVKQSKLTKIAEDDSLKVIITGGDAELIYHHSTVKYEVNPDLVFLGLKQFL